MKNQKISINFLIPIYLIHKDSEKYKITELSFKYYVFLKNLFINEINMNFTILGSEENLSKNLTLKYFDKNSYIEYNQKGINYQNRVSYDTLNTIVGGKIAYGFEQAKLSNPDFIIFIKSNHIISREWIKYISSNFNENHNKFFAFSSENNVFIISNLNSNNEIDLKNVYLMDGRYKTPCRIHDACLIAIPRKCYENYKMNPVCLTENTIINELINIGCERIIQNKNLHFHIFNIKAIDENQNITPLNLIQSLTEIEKIEESSIKKDIEIYRDITLLNNSLYLDYFII